MNQLLFVSMLLLAGTTTVAQTRPVAKANQKVWIVSYPVQAQKRQQYEHFVHDIFWAGASKLSAAKDKQVLRQTRVLHPTKANPDGSWSYFFIMDPVIEGADYDIGSLLRKMYGTKQGSDYFKLFATALVPNAKYHDDMLMQSKD